MEQFLKETKEQFFQSVEGTLSLAVAEIATKCYNDGWEACKKFYRIDDDKFLKEQEKIETKYMGSYKTTTEVYNGKSKNKIKVG